ncbi:MAG: hypothetical protein RBR27_05590, partial [Bacilli bacterium]|nr:hypothetical protein [Bacilli bacterium]
KIESQDEHVTANIIYNLAHLGISLKDARYIDIDVYVELINLELKTISNEPESRRATQKDIDLFLL